MLLSLDRVYSCSLPEPATVTLSPLCRYSITVSARLPQTAQLIQVVSSLPVLAARLNSATWVSLTCFSSGSLPRLPCAGDVEHQFFSVEEFGDDCVERHVDHAVMALLCVMAQLVGKLLIKPNLKVIATTPVVLQGLWRLLFRHTCWRLHLATADA